MGRKLRKMKGMVDDGFEHVFPRGEEDLHRRNDCPCGPEFVSAPGARGYCHRSMKPANEFPENWTEEDAW